jgi:hypothetical protein
MNSIENADDTRRPITENDFTDDGSPTSGPQKNRDRATPLSADLDAIASQAPTFLDTLKMIAKNGIDFFSMKIPERPRLVGDWFRDSDLGYIFAPRGIGKTWYAHALIASLTTGRDFGPWKVPSRVPVALLDGEMPPDAVQERLKSLGADPTLLVVLSHQFLFDEAERSFQLGDPEQRHALLVYCRHMGIRVLVIDNLSSLSNVPENDNDAWTDLGEWLLDFQRSRIAVVVVHHAGKNGTMRGSSRREDRASFTVSLADSRERTATKSGARFVASFTKHRYAMAQPETMDWHFSKGEDGSTKIEIEAADTDALVYQAIREGNDSCSFIAEELNVAKGTVSKAAKRLQKLGKITISGGKYNAT